MPNRYADAIQSSLLSKRLEHLLSRSRTTPPPPPHHGIMNGGTFTLEITFISYCIHVQAALFCVEAIGKQKPTEGDTFGVVGH